jgi:hypothetical protein
MHTSNKVEGECLQPCSRAEGKVPRSLTIRIKDGQPDAHSEPGNGDVQNIVTIRKNTARGGHTVKGRQDVYADIGTTTYL